MDATMKKVILVIIIILAIWAFLYGVINLINKRGSTWKNVLLLIAGIFGILLVGFEGFNMKTSKLEDEQFQFARARPDGGVDVARGFGTYMF